MYIGFPIKPNEHFDSNCCHLPAPSAMWRFISAIALFKLEDSLLHQTYLTPLKVAIGVIFCNKSLSRSKGFPRHFESARAHVNCTCARTSEEDERSSRESQDVTFSGVFQPYKCG